MLPFYRPRITRLRQRGLPSFMAGVLPWYQQKKLDGVDPTFFADFANNRYAVNGVERSFSDVFTHTRASTKTFFGSNGLLQTAAINAPVFDYDPVTLLPMGLNNEEQRTNVLKHSTSPVSSWFGVSATVTAASGSMLGMLTGGINVASTGANVWNTSITMLNPSEEQVAKFTEVTAKVNEMTVAGNKQIEEYVKERNEAIELVKSTVLGEPVNVGSAVAAQEPAIEAVE